MKHPIKAGVAVLALAVSAGVAAQDVDAPVGRVKPTLVAPELAAATQRAQRDGVAADFGTGVNILQIPAASFTPRISTTVYSYSSNGYKYWTSAPNGEVFWATVTLPSGAAVSWLDAYVCDTDGTNDLTFTLRAYTGSTSPSFFDVVANTPATSAGCDYFASPVNGLFGPPHTVNNDVQYNGGGQYTILVEGPTTSSSALRWKAVDLWWSRQISPAPVTATFTDVPTNAQFFREVEALANSGITSGCTATTFCPDNFVTRRQMAAFLSRALGLSYQY